MDGAVEGEEEAPIEEEMEAKPVLKKPSSRLGVGLQKVIEKKPAGVQKKPAAQEGGRRKQQWLEVGKGFEGEELPTDDQSTNSTQQRHVLGKCMGDLPDEVKSKLEEARGQGNKKLERMLINSLIPKDSSYDSNSHLRWRGAGQGKARQCKGGEGDGDGDGDGLWDGDWGR
eukprot:15477775-Alexandrium_andersonii.AAC.1